MVSCYLRISTLLLGRVEYETIYYYCNYIAIQSQNCLPNARDQMKPNNTNNDKKIRKYTLAILYLLNTTTFCVFISFPLTACPLCDYFSCVCVVIADRIFATQLRLTFHRKEREEHVSETCFSLLDVTGLCTGSEPGRLTLGLY